MAAAASFGFADVALKANVFGLALAKIAGANKILRETDKTNRLKDLLRITKISWQME
jgi:hypothetical protein